MKSNKMRKDKAIDLLIVVLFLIMISAIAIPWISDSATKAKANACYTNIDVLNSAIEMYNNKTGSYPKVLSEVTDNKAYFPDGVPVCPVDGNPYPDELTPTDMVDYSEHNH